MKENVDAADRTIGMTLYFPLLIALLVSISISTLSLGIYHTYLVPRSMKFATVDLAEVMQIKELQIAAMVNRLGVTNKERGDAYDAIGLFSQQIEEATAALQRECGCLLLVKSAIVNGGVEDITPALKERLGMGNIDMVKLVDDMRKNTLTNRNAVNPR